MYICYRCGEIQLKIYWTDSSRTAVGLLARRCWLS